MKKWKSWPFWLRGIVVAEILYILFFATTIFIDSKYPCGDPVTIIPMAIGVIIASILSISSSSNIFAFSALFFNLIICGLLGALIGKFVWKTRNVKRGWKNWPYWVKGAVLFNIIFLIVFILLLLIESIFKLDSPIVFWPAMPGLMFLNLFKLMGFNVGVNSAVLILSSCFIMYGLIGALFGLFVGIRRSDK